MLNLITWDKPLMVDGTVYNNSTEAYNALKHLDGNITITLNFKACTQEKPLTGANTLPQQNNATDGAIATEKPQDNALYKIKVRQYMTKEWEFNDKYNFSDPMPMRVMVGTKIEERGSLVKFKLYGKPMPTDVCMKCGKRLTHPVSLHYGIGPECGKHFHINPYDDEDTLNAEYALLTQKMADVKWTGWIPKSGIEEIEVIDNE